MLSQQPRGWMSCLPFLQTTQIACLVEGIFEVPPSDRAPSFLPPFCILEGPPPPLSWLCTLNKECNSSGTSVEDICMLASRLGPCIFIRCYMLDAGIGLNNLWMTMWVSVSQLHLSLSFLQWRLFQDLNSDFLFLGSTCSSTDRWSLPFNFAKLLLGEQLVQPCLLEWDTAPSWTFPK